jgi:diguanylate cyclase (GGDEF)-like protein/PAS domain S-box-containing protein
VPPWRKPRRRFLALAYSVAMVAAMLAILGVVANSIRLLDDMSGDVSEAQRRAENLSNSQREILRLLLAVTELATAGPASEAQRNAVELRRGLFDRQLDVSYALFPAASPEADEGRAIMAEMAGLDWAAVQSPTPDPVRIRNLINGLTAVEKRVKALYDGQTRLFYTATTRSLRAKEQGEVALGGLVALVAALGCGWFYTTRRRAAAEAAQVSERRFRTLVQRASDLTGVTDGQGVITYVSPAVEPILGFPPDDFIGTDLCERVHPEDQQRLLDAATLVLEHPSGTATVDFRVATRDGRWRNIEAVGRNLLEDQTIGGVVWNGRDVTDRRLLEDELTFQAFHDALTGLPNRALMLNRMDQALAAAEDGAGVTVLLIDLDGFKDVNDTLGHHAGDTLLRQVADRLTRCLRGTDTAARLGGDEFAVVFDGSPAIAITEITARILAAIREPIDVDGRAIRVGASIGVAVSGPDRVTSADLLRDADIAMYAAKSAGKNRVEVFRPEMRTSIAERSALEQDLLRAVERGQIQLSYQPIVDLTTGAVLAVEALARWRHPDLGLIGPTVFIPIAERSGHMDELGRFVLAEACATTAMWRRTMPHHADLRVCVNVSGRQVLSGDLVATVVDAVNVSGLPPSGLVLEITETVFLEESEAVRTQFAQLRALGIHVAIDDFGSGYSSVGSLLRFPADLLKIDRSCLEVGGDLVSAVAALGRTLGLQVIVEGVETTEHLRQAADGRCHAVQGYLFARPADEEQTTELLMRDPCVLFPVAPVAGFDASTPAATRRPITASGVTAEP